MPAHGTERHVNAIAIPNLDGSSATFTDRLGRDRVVRKTKRGWQVKNFETTVAISLAGAIAPLIGGKIKSRRLALGMELAELCEAAGITAAHPKARMWEIENNTRGNGILIGTLYAIAHALHCDPRDLLPSVQEALEAGNVKAHTRTVLRTNIQKSA